MVLTVYSSVVFLAVLICVDCHNRLEDELMSGHHMIALQSMKQFRKHRPNRPGGGHLGTSSEEAAAFTCDSLNGRLFRGQCYVINYQQLTWQEARAACERENGDLAMTVKKPIFKFLDRYTKGIESDVWIGASDIMKEGVFRWVDGTTLRWKIRNLVGGLDDSSSEEAKDCIALNAQGADLKEKRCTARLPYVCEFAVMGDEFILDMFANETEELEKLLEGTNVHDAILNINTQQGFKEDMFEGDIKLTNKQCRRESLGASPLDPEINQYVRERIGGFWNPGYFSRMRRNVLGESYASYFWPDAIVPYKIKEKAYTSDQLDQIQQAMDGMTDQTCLRFVPYTDQPDYLYIAPDSGCWSYIGRIRGRQKVSLDADCTLLVGTIQHELMHAIGFWHEQARPDRDDYITVLYSNILKDKFGEFNKIENPALLDTRDVPYDYGSIMHYGATAFTKNGQATIRPLQPDVVIGQRNQLSPVDVLEINLVYKCPMTVDGNWNQWSMWTACDKTCGGGQRMRERKCNLPEPQNGGLDCMGESQEVVGCYTENCPTEIEYGHIGCWLDAATPELLDSLEGNPDVTHILDGHFASRDNKIEKCALAAQTFGVTVFALRFGGKCYIQEAEEDSDLLYMSKGPSDVCVNGLGATNAIDAYTLVTGAIDGQWGVWNEPNQCSATCGGGTRTRTRRCDNPKPRHNGDQCPGDAEEVLECSFEPCPVSGGWGDWSRWSKCSEECGSYSLRTRRRKCDSPPPANDGDDCLGQSLESERCDVPPCNCTGAPGSWESWCEWSECSGTCGPGHTRCRTRECSTGVALDCVGDEDEVQDCPLPDCDTDCDDDCDDECDEEGQGSSLTSKPDSTGGWDGYGSSEEDNGWGGTVGGYWNTAGASWNTNKDNGWGGTVDASWNTNKDNGWGGTEGAFWSLDEDDGHDSSSSSESS